MVQPEQHIAGDSGERAGARKVEAAIPLPLVSDARQRRQLFDRSTALTYDRAGRAVDLPEQPMALIGRDRLLESSVAQLARPQIRLMTLIGPGGVGKTRLACEVARQAAPQYDLVRFIDLAPLHDDLVAAAIADAVDVDQLSRSIQIDQLQDLLPNRILLVLDNFEHVLHAAPQVAQVLVSTRNLDLLVTSREPLRLRWEHLVPVAPLTLPRSSDRLSIEERASVPAVALFVGLVQRLHPHFELTEANAEIVAEICQRLDGLPLALELAAPKLQVLSLSRLRDQLEYRLDALDRGPRDLPPRQRSMRAALEWSYELLTPEEQLVARRAAIFAGGGSDDAAEVIIQLPAEAGSVHDLLSTLAEKSLLTLDTSDESSPRFTMLTTVRKYLLQRLASVGEQAVLEQRFAEYYLELAGRTAADLGGYEGSAMILALNRERENFRAILQATVDRRRTAVGLRLALALTSYWKRSGQLAEASRWLEQLALQCDMPEFAKQRVEALVWAGRFALFRGDLKTAGEYLDDALSQSSSHATWRTEVTFELAHIRLAQGNTPAAEGLLRELQARLNELDPSSIQYAEEGFLRGAIMAVHGRSEEARRLLSAASALFEAADANEPAASVMLTLADLELVEGAIEPAKRLYLDALARSRRAGNWRLETRSRIGLGIVANQEQNESATLSNLRAAFEAAERYGDEFSLALIIDTLAMLGVSRSRLDPRWLQLTGLADAMFDRLGLSLTTPERRRTASRRQMAREILGDDEVKRFEADGRRLSLGYIRTMLDEIRAAEWTCSSDEEDADGEPSRLERLSRREREVVQLITRGLTNRQIALELDIAERTVDSHVSNLLRKLKLPSRVSAAAWAVQHGLLKL